MAHNLAYTRRSEFQIDYGWEIEQEIVRIQATIERCAPPTSGESSRWLALKLLEQDQRITLRFKQLPGGQAVLEAAQHSISHLHTIFAEDTDTLIADRRYGWIHGLVRETVQVDGPNRRLLSDRIDDIVTHRLLGIPIFLLLMWLVFRFTTDLSAPLLDWISAVVEGPLLRWTAALLGLLGLSGSWVESLLLEGVIAGVGSLMAFIPVLMALYCALAILEDSGYMARAAFVMDRFMHLLGLHGKSFLPLIVGFGCSVPGIFATRTLENEKDRVLTGLMVPFMSCGARLPVYVLIAGIFFAEKAGVIVFWMYLIGIVTAVLAGLLLKSTVFRHKQESPFVLELPPYRVPTLRSVWAHMWEHTSGFISKAGSLILGMSLVIWLLLAIPVQGSGRFATAPLEHSAFAAAAQAFEPLLKPAGFGAWQNAGALFSGVAAKEVIVASLAQVYGAEGSGAVPEAVHLGRDLLDILNGLARAVFEMVRAVPRLVGLDLLADEAPAASSAPTGTAQIAPAILASFQESSGGHASLAAFAFMVFVLTYTPCMATLAALRKELGLRWMLLSAGGQLLAAWLLAVLIFQAGRLLGVG